ncbi:LysM peptidoglycan-binding domain-containing protein [Bifidobacterium goeldii]|nr:LysM peptidoglycan-binding domain-containing protein [Bifidobacterium goeldii]
MSYIVQPGDTLWSYAEDITPKGGDVRDTVDDLIAMNGLDDMTLHAGQKIIVPVE